MQQECPATCPGCHNCLVLPYIQCTMCKPLYHLCNQCFSRGYESHGHSSDHSYCVIKDDFILFEKGWTAGEEIKLLDAINDCGIGNWHDIANQVQTKNKYQCEKHYSKYYISMPHKELPTVSFHHVQIHPSPVLFRITNDPPRPPVGSSLHTEMAGYMAAASEFSQEFDNHAEHDLKDIDCNDPSSPMEEGLKFAVINKYQSVLLERQRRRRLVRKYGLINMSKAAVCNKRYERTLKHLVEGLKVFTRLLEPEEHSKYLESLNYEFELKSDIRKLQEFRTSGITCISSASLYSKLKARRYDENAKRHALKDVLSRIQDETACQQWLHKAVLEGSSSSNTIINLPNATRKSAPPLDIMGMPGFEKLKESEKKLCANVRLSPEAFLEFKKILVREHERLGYLRLAQARPLIKIDVNKTRKIYDFLHEEGLINIDP